MKYASGCLMLIGALGFAEVGHAQQGLAASFGLFVYPSDGQATDQQAKDEGECYQWSRQMTGVDPANPLAGVSAQQASPQPPQGAAIARGALRGSAGAALIGNIADQDAGEYALAGALIGGIRGSRRADKQQEQAQQQAAAQSQTQTQERMQIFKNGFSACMEGRKYTVK
jgi:hypothetical protein